MKLNHLLVGFFSFVLVLIFIVTGSLYWQLQQVEQKLSTDLPSLLGGVDSASELDYLANQIKYYDEVLTMSARNYAFTGDSKWKVRYFEIVPKLDVVLVQAVERGSLTEEEFFRDVDLANSKLVFLEEKAISLVDQGSGSEAVKILESEEYWHQKKIYLDALGQYVSTRGLSFEQVVKISTEKIHLLGASIDKTFKIILATVLSFIVVSGVLFIILIFYISPVITNPLVKLSKTVDEVSKGNLKVQIEKSGNIDEINNLADSLERVMVTMKLAIKDVAANGSAIGGVGQRKKKLAQENKGGKVI